METPTSTHPIIESDYSHLITIGEKYKNESGKWKLSYGTHNGEYDSRAVADGKYDSYELCVKEFLKLKSISESSGFFIWFANVITPETKVEIKLDPGNPNYNN